MATTRQDLRDSSIEQIRRLAEGAFADHHLKTVLSMATPDGHVRHWRCARLGDSAYAFNITTIPGRIIVTGDIGCLVVERTTDMIAWCRGSIDSIDYFAEKFPHEIPTKEYDPELAKQWVIDAVGVDAEYHGEATIAKIREEFPACSYDFWNKHQFYTDLSDCRIFDGCDWPDFDNFRPSFLWCREAIKWLLNRLPT